MILLGNQTNTLPVIVYDEIEGLISIKGRSTAPTQVVKDYFEDFLPYLKDCLERKPLDIRISVELEFFSTTTSKLLMEFFYIMKDHEKRGSRVTVNWYYEEGDDDMLDSGEDYQDLSKLKFDFIETPE